MLNSFILAIGTLFTAITPVMLAWINYRQNKTDIEKAAVVERNHQELLKRTIPIAKTN